MKKLVYAAMLAGAVLVSSGASAVSVGFVSGNAVTASVTDNEEPPKPKKLKKNSKKGAYGRKKAFDPKKKNNKAKQKAHNKKFMTKAYAIN